ncbi:MAG: DUF3108 domain-containing protein [Candidatus Sulfobium sp.]|jgi:hypothetical protein
MKILRLVAAVSLFSLVSCPALAGGSFAAAQGGAGFASSLRMAVADYSHLFAEAGTATKISSLSERAEGKAGIFRSAGEKLYFDIYWMGIYVGNATLEETGRGAKVTITSEVHSAPVISVLYKVKDHASSTVVDGKPVNFRIRQREGRYRSDKETRFDPDNGRITYFDYRKGIKAEHEVENMRVWDVISGFYHLRTLALETGKTLSIDVFDSNKMLKAEAHVLRKEKVAFPGKGEVDAFVIKPVLRSEGLFKHRGDILIWLTGDKSRIPVRVETRVSIGKVVAELKRVEVAR